METTTDTRTEEILRLRDEGATLKEIGDTVGLTRERIRQILFFQGKRTLTYEEKIDAVAAAWHESGELSRPDEVLREHGLVPSTRGIAMLRARCKDLTLPDTKSGAGPSWDIGAAATAVHRVAIENGIDPATGWMRALEYAKWRAPTDPSTATIGANYSWNDVMILAGFHAENAPSRGRALGYRPEAFTEEDLDRAVLAYLDSKPAKFTTVGFEDYLKSREDLPSLGTIRNRFRKRGIPTISGILSDVANRRSELEAEPAPTVEFDDAGRAGIPAMRFLAPAAS